MRIEDILTRLRGVQRNGKEWKALCPAHTDKNPSLSVCDSDGRILLHCHTGCPPEAVCAGMGVAMNDLFLNDGFSPQIVAEYDYHNEQGDVIYQVVRSVPKGFRQRRPDGNGGWIWNLSGVRRVLYRLPEVLKTKSVLIVEGERDCETARQMGIVATCNAGGAGKWREEYTDCLRGKRVAVIADADDPGRKHAQQVAVSLFGNVESLKVLELPRAKDLTEWVEKGGAREALLELVRNTQEWKNQAGQSVVTPLVALAVEELLTREIKPREMLLDPIVPEQGLAMLYAYRGIGKTHLALGIAAAVASGTRFLRWTAPHPRRVLYVAANSRLRRCENGLR